MNDWLGRTAPDLDVIERMASATVADLPPQFAAAASLVLLRVTDFAPEDFLDRFDRGRPGADREPV